MSNNEDYLKRLQQKQEKLFAATNGGFDIIRQYYPQIDGQSSNKKFKLREDDKTPSAAIKQLRDGNYVVTDFGGDQTSRNAIQIAMLEDTLSYSEALNKWCGEYRIGDIQKTINRAGFIKRPATVEETEGTYIFDIKENLTVDELALMGPIVKQEHCDTYKVYSLNSFSYIKNREAMVTSSNENYPIFLIENKDDKGNEWKKIYQPLSYDKSFRFRYTGHKPKDYINGLEQLQKAHAAHLEQQQEEWVREGEKGKFKPTKLDACIIVSGERDALNVAALGYCPVWFNSETARITEHQMRELAKCTERQYYLPDLDKTGEREANKRGLAHLDLRIIQLPAKLQSFKDNRGKMCKDFRDYVEIYPNKMDFKKLLDVAMPMRFYDRKFANNTAKYEYNSEHAAQFLQASGFYTLENKNLKEGAELIHIKDNIVRNILPKDVKKYMRNFCVERHLPIEVRNLLRSTAKISDSALMELKERKIDFSSFDQNSQHVFFRNKILKITADEIIQFNPGTVEKYVWEEEVIPHNFKMKDAPFTITRDENGKYDIEIHDTSSKFLCFLINSSRIHWQAELEDRIRDKSPEEQEVYRLKHKFDIAGEMLSADEKAEQKQHLLNKLFALGYMMHRYKNPAKAWAIWAMDNKLSPDGESHGRSGKSFCWKSMHLFQKSVSLPGRNPKLTENPHMFDRVTEYTRYILVDDANEHLKFEVFFDCITGEFIVNPKNNQSYEIPYAISPKFVFTSNFVLKQQDPSTIARLLYTVFSDYYHEKGDEEEYRETRKISDDFNGKNLFGEDYTEAEWNADYITFMHILKFYLSVPGTLKINPPMDNVSTRQQMTIMGDAFKMWADTYFALDGGRVDSFVDRGAALKAFVEESNLKGWSTNKFTKALKAFCRLNDYTYNPKVYQNAAGRISRKNDDQKTVDMVYIQTKPITEEAPINGAPLVQAPKNKKEDGLPF